MGKFGFFKLIETAYNIDSHLDTMGTVWAITQMAHKPYPAGRATQSVLTMFTELLDSNVIQVDAIEEIVVEVPPLIMFLVGRPLTDSMTASYARLCLKFIGPMMLLDGEVDPRLFPDESAPSEEIKALGNRFNIKLNDITDPNALGPQSCTIVLKTGERHSAFCEHPYGAPGNPMRRAAREAKVRKCYEVGNYEADPQILIDMIETIESLPDIRSLFSTVCDGEPSGV